MQPAVPEVKLVNELLAGVEPVEGDSMLVEGFLVIAELVRPVHGPDSQVVGEREFVQMGPIPAGVRVIDRDRELSMSGTRVTGCRPVGGA